MLTTLVGLPAAWIYYGPLPEGQQQVLDDLIDGATNRARETLGWDVERTQAATAKPQAAGDLPVEFEPAEHAFQEQTLASIPAPSEPSHSAETAQNGADFEPLLKQLRHLGVSEYDLETWGEAQSLYRFHCSMPLVLGPLAESSELSQQFEAVTSDPQESIAQVVAEVAQWHAGRQVH